MLDRYWFGDVERISPEAPVPVVKIARSEERPGGAANVARNAAALGAQATLHRVIGDDEPGARSSGCSATEHVRTSFHRDPSLPTTVKLRVIGRQQQLLRIDFETLPSHEVLATQARRLRARCCRNSTSSCCPITARAASRTSRAMIEQARARGQAGAGRPQGRGLDCAIAARRCSRRTAREFRQVVGRWQRRGGARRPRRRRCAPSSTSMRCCHALGGGHDALHRRRRAAHPGASRARSTTSPAPATR